MGGCICYCWLRAEIARSSGSGVGLVGLRVKGLYRVWITRVTLRFVGDNGKEIGTTYLGFRA